MCQSTFWVYFLSIGFMITFYSHLKLFPLWPAIDGEFHKGEYSYLGVVYLVPLYLFFHIRKKEYLLRLLLQIIVVVAMVLVEGFIGESENPAPKEMYRFALYYEAFKAAGGIVLVYIVGKLTYFAFMILEWMDEKQR